MARHAPLQINLFSRFRTSGLFASLLVEPPTSSEVQKSHIAQLGVDLLSCQEHEREDDQGCENRDST
jgi:hypothetical protein